LATGRGKGGECDAEDHDKRVCDNNNKCICSGGDNGRRRLSNSTAAPTPHSTYDPYDDVPPLEPTHPGYYWAESERDCQCQTKLQGWQIGLIVVAALLGVVCLLGLSKTCEAKEDGGGGGGRRAKVGEERQFRAEPGPTGRAAPMAEGTILGYEQPHIENGGGFRQAPMAAGTVVGYAPTTTAHDGPPTSAADELRKLADMKQQGLLTDEEFSTAKAKLLARM
jgi:hypothetical protein